MYAHLCRKLRDEVRNFDSSGNIKESTFCVLLLKKCQDEFENRSKANEIFERKNGPLTGEEAEQCAIAKAKMLGNIRFIGELGKLDMLHESVLHKCIKQLLEKKRRLTGSKDVAEDMECLCQIMRTVGISLDTEKARPLMSQYFGRMSVLADNMELPSRIRFMLQDTLELRLNKWAPRNVIVSDGPKTIKQIRDEAAKDYGVYITPGGRGSDMAPMMPRSSQITKPRGGMDDVFSSIPLGASTLGTGPGVISTDSFNGYSSNMGRPGRSQGMFFMSNQASQNSYSYQNRQNQQQNSMSSMQYSSQQQTYNSAGGKEVPPRFLKKTTLSGNPDEISLRPAQNSMVLKPNTPSMLPKSAIPNPSPPNQESMVQAPQPLLASQKMNPLINPLIQKEAPILIKQASLEKNKTNKKEQGPTKEEIVKKLDLMLVDLTSQNIDESVSTMKEIKIPKKLFPELLNKLMGKTMDKAEEDREAVSKLFTAIKKEGLVLPYQLLEAFRLLLNELNDLEVEFPRVKSYVAGFVARAIIDSLIGISEIAECLENGSHYPLFLLCLQHLHKIKGKAWLGTTFAESKVNLILMLPELDRSMEKLLDLLEDRGLSFLFPLLRIQAELWKQVQADANPITLYKWIKENVDSSQYIVPGFINAVMSCIVRYINEESNIATTENNVEAPADKNQQEKEKDVLEKFKPVLDAFLHDHIDLQVVSLYAVQVYCHNQGYPKGMLLRWFVMLYDLEVVEEEAFLKWKEDITEDYPGKGKALFQVNQWLTWLEEAEEDTSDGEDI